MGLTLDEFLFFHLVLTMSGHMSQKKGAIVSLLTIWVDPQIPQHCPARALCTARAQDVRGGLSFSRTCRKGRMTENKSCHPNGRPGTTNSCKAVEGKNEACNNARVQSTGKYDIQL